MFVHFLSAIDEFVLSVLQLILISHIYLTFHFPKSTLQIVER